MSASVSFKDDSSFANAAIKQSIPNKFDGWNVNYRYDLIDILGKGSYGQVAKAIDRYAYFKHALFIK